ncbi:MAG TPA: signal peptide peptidase SppA [archaeon]|nr:signal peptide peptidase SppA [archaeon]
MKKKNSHTYWKIGFGLLGIVLILIALSVLASFYFPFDSSAKMKGNIASIPVKGEIILDGEASVLGSSFGVQRIIDDITAAESDPGIDAIVLEINSPGGSVYASKKVVDEILKAEKPVVAYITEIGASGGYYIAAASDEIYADEDSITGSIGVISVLMNFEGLFEKLGLKANVFKEGEFKDIGSPFREMTEEEKALFQEILAQAFNNFKKDLRDFRGSRLDLIKFDEIADGRIMTGQQALEVGLIDQTGSIDSAYSRASFLAGKDPDKYDVWYYGKIEFSFFDLFAKAGSAFGNGLKQSLKAETNLQGIRS